MRSLFALLFLCVAGTAADPLGAQPATVAGPRIGFLSPNVHVEREAAFRDELARLGHVDGKTVTIDYRSADNDFSRLPALARELVERKSDIIVAVVTQASLEAKHATAKIPIVMVGVSDPVASKLIASLSRPGGNVTGTSTPAGDVVAKQLELVREIVPRAARIAVLWNPANAEFQRQQMVAAKPAAARLDMQLTLFEAHTAQDIVRVFDAIVAARADALLVLADPFLASQASRIADLATARRLPAIGASAAVARAGLLAAYGPDYVFAYRRAADYVDRILKGAKPAELPVERSSRFELVINDGTAKRIGLPLPARLVARADEVVP